MSGRPVLHLLIVVAALFSAVVLFMAGDLASRLHRRVAVILGIAFLIAYPMLLLLRVSNWFWIDFLLLAFAVVIGSFVGRRLASESALIVFIVTAAVADLLSFSGGATDRIIEDYGSGKSLLLQHLCISIPVQGRILPLVGIGDLIVLAVIFAALRGLGHPRRARLFVPLLGLLAALGVGLALHGIFAVPFLSAALLVYLMIRRRRRTVH